MGGSSRKGATKTKRAYRTAHAHHRGEIRPESRPKAQPGMAGAIAGRLGRVCLAYSARYPRLRVEECGGSRAAFGDLSQIEEPFELWVRVPGGALEACAD